MIYWFPEAYRWTRGSTWLGIVNPTTAAQLVTVTLTGVTNLSRQVSLPPRSRTPFELGAWGASGDFGVEVRCGTGAVCAPALTMWDAQFATAHESIPVQGCELP